MKVLLAIVVDDAGNLGVQNNEPDLLRAFGLLDVARDVLKDVAKQAATKTPGILLARGNLPPLNGGLPRGGTGTEK